MKSHLHIKDYIDAIIHATHQFLESGARVDVYNVGPIDQVKVKKIADIVGNCKAVRTAVRALLGKGEHNLDRKYG